MNNTMTTLNYNNGRYSANEAIDNFILGNKASKYKHSYIGNNAVPCCDMEKCIIYSPVLPPVINFEMDKIIRGKNEHEAGHGRLTPCNKKPHWSKVKGNLINALEDQRIERGVKAMSKAFESDIDYLNRHYIEKINQNFSVNGVSCKPIDEAIMALHIKETGLAVKWELTPMAKMLYDVAEPIFAEWVNADYITPNGFELIEDITDRIIAEWEKLNNNNNNNEENEDELDNESNNKPEKNLNSKNNGDNTEDDGDDTEDDGDDTEDDGDDTEDDGDDTESKSKKYDDSQLSENSSNNSLDDMCDDENELDKLMEKDFREMIETAKEELGDYTAYTAEDEIIRSVKDKGSFDCAYSEIAGAISMLSSYMEQSLRSMSRCRNINNRDKGYLNVRSLPMVAKNLTKNAFYTKKQGISLDTTVSILIDESGSMNNSIAHCRSLAIAMAEVLERLGIKFEILGHTTACGSLFLDNTAKNQFSRSLPMKIFEHKNFNENYQSEKYRLGSMYSHSCNIDGEALLTTFKRAMEQKSNRHIIMVLSDGEPSGASYGGREHLKKVVQFCRNNGAEVYGFGIGTKTPEVFYGKENFIFLPSIKDMNGQFFRQLSNIITNGSMVK